MEDFKKIAEKWQKKWEKDKTFEANEDPKRKKFYCLEMFPYPSGSGLHVGHAFNYTIGDIYARFKRLNGFNVLYPMGYDSLGLPAENAAIKEKVHPRDYTEKAIASFIRQQKALGLSYDWNRMIKTHDPSYYKWDQWIFLKMLEKGLAYRKKAPVNYCSKCETVLANEQVHNGKCWRHKDTDVEIKHLEQWFFNVTKYAEELYDKVDELTEWPERIKAMQRNWIGKSHGTEVIFEINEEKWPVFTTRPDTIYGVTFMVISAQHPKLMELVTKKQKDEVENFLKKIKSTSEKDMDLLEKEGAFTGAYATNPLTKNKIPVYAGNFVVAEYGCGMVMAVPAHDQRDFEFAKKYKIPITVVIQPSAYELNAERMARAYISEGHLINSGEFNGINNNEAIEKISIKLEKMKLGKRTLQYKLRDWLVSRQRYWGTPIPVVYCDKCGIVPVPEKDLPVILPDDIKFGEGNPLKTSKKFAEVKCPKCEGKARREMDTMDTFVNSSWYFLRYCDPKNDKKIFDKKKTDYWAPVDAYIGGAEHACMHLIYFRFYTKFFRDLKLLNYDEPVKLLFNQGMVHGSDGFVMSKSRGNVVDPLVMIDKYGTDTLRFYLVSNAGPDKDFAWNDDSIEGSFKFVNRVMNYFETVKIEKSSKRSESKLNRAIKEITEYINDFKYNLATIKVRELFESLSEEESKDTLEKALKLLHPFCPHITEELWEKIGNKPYISLSSWPKYDESKIDLKSEQHEKIAENTKLDIKSIMILAKIVKPKKIKLIVSPEWKYALFEMLKKILNETRDQKEIIQKIMASDLKVYGQEIMKIVPSVIKDMSKMPEVLLPPEEEMDALKKTKTFEEFGCEIEIESAEKSKEQKAKQAMPGKPAILVN